MKTTCSILLLLFCTVAGRKLHESAEGAPQKCEGPFDASNTTLYRTEGIGAGRGCDAFRGKQLPMDEALGLIVRLTSPPTSNALQFNLQKETLVATLAPSKACRLENWEGHGRIGKSTLAGSSSQCTPWSCTSSGSGRKRHLMTMTTQGDGDEDEDEDAVGPADDGLETGDDEVGEGEAAFTACNDRCCVLLIVKQKDVDAVFGASAN